MVPDLQATGITLAALSAIISGWVAFRCPRLQTSDRDWAVLRATMLAAIVGVLFALGAGLVMIPRLFYVGELLVLAGGSFVPLVWAWLGHRIVSESEETTLTSRRLFGLSLTGVLFFIIYLLVSRPVFSDDIWFVESGERWLFFMLLILGAWAVSYFERAFRWSTIRHRKKMRWLRVWIALLFGIWILASGEGFFLARMHMFWLPWLALAQAGSLAAAYRFFHVRATEQLPLSFSRRAAYTSAIAVILGGYLVVLGVMGKIVRWAGGDLEAYLSVLAGFLAILLLSVLIALPSVGRRVHRFVDRHLYKGRIDFTAEWTKITDEISGILDLPSLVKTVAGFLKEAFSDRVYIFLPIPGRGGYALYYPFGHDLTETLPADGESADWLWRLGEPVFLANWISRSMNTAETEFIKKLEESLDGRIAVPLVARRRFLGFAVLGERRDRPDYDDGDFEFLSAMSGPVAFAVLTGQVSEELLARREMESFDRLSTFIVHDLKNSVSMLSMLLQNAEKHMADPAFQESALKTINGAVDGMQHLIGKISGGKDRLRPEPKPVDLNQTIEEIVSQTGLSSHPHIDFQFNPGHIPAAVGDPIHIRRVMENLLVNAVEAMLEQGSLEMSTGSRNGPGGPWVWVRVRDTGCGMTREFISTRLFKPFESTKQKGLGIGMYQVKQMVEADGGQIQLQSEPGQGTTFEVFWRAQSKSGPTNAG